jgi:HEAT repeat protein
MNARADWRAAVIAGHRADEPAARRAIGDADPTTREFGYAALHRMECLTDSDLAAAIIDPAPAVRRRAALIAAQVPSADLAPLLLDTDSTVVEAAAWAAGEHAAATDHIVEQLVHLGTASTDALVREAAVAALGAIGDERGLPAILAGCRDKPAIRRRAVLALAPFDGPEVEAALAAALTDHDWQVRQSAEDVSPQA